MSLASESKAPHIFGIRHLSPGGAHHLLQFLDAVNPTAVLVEGLSDANSQIEFFTAKGTELPVAILAYTEELPVRTLFYPFAAYCPEYQAFVWAKAHRAHAEFIDLPSDVFLKLSEARRRIEAAAEKAAGGEGRKDCTESLYARWAGLAGEQDYDTYWERRFEHNLNSDSYRLAAYELGQSLRELAADSRAEQMETLVREAYMRNRIQRTIQAGHDPDRIVVVTGAYHASVLGPDYPAMTDAEIAALPRVKSRLTLMPYSFYRLSSRSGYGAGNAAPAYFDLMWQHLRRGDIKQLVPEYLSGIARYMREHGIHRSTAEVIEAVRLANALAGLNGGSQPSLKDLQDAAVTCLGHGDLHAVAEAIAAGNVGTAIGSLPEGVVRTSIQDDFYRELKRLKLEKYRSAVAMDLELDLRENRRVQSREAAFIDLSRSFFLHRLQALNISFQQQKRVAQDSATWAENWVLQWTPEAEIQLVEAALLGDTVELAAAYAFKERLDNSPDVATAAQIIRQACECGMPESMEYARGVLQQLAVENGALAEIAGAAYDLSTVISYGDIRKFDAAPLLPLLQQLFLRGTLLLVDACRCDNSAAGGIVDAVNKLNAIALEHDTRVDEPLWLQTLTELSGRDDRNPRLSGLACAILLERNKMSNEQLAREVARRLSPGIDADMGAGWFEGLAARNKYALLTRLALWQQIAGYVASLDERQFTRALVFLRRAFSDFSAAEKTASGKAWGKSGG
ncbi:DUF5682 family protein [Acetonema longum]|uniref:Uncharacterized protein n=1 Tax=Acetonema longum DSM 6540 TaxID=1009370 RepID=F7NE56_9FIRM|nr:DUF5682 family protein [Acetonema longum]EGO65711.1 hypothetical protein ALO_01594 [Acetonema longum DSM 6540]